MARKRRRGMGCLAVVLLLAAGAAAAVWVPDLLERHAYKLETQSCIATHGDYVDYRTPEQANNAAIIAAVGMSYGFDVRGVTVAIATAIQESDLRSLDYGDRDSLGLFQQRPSQGWGEPEQVIDPHYASSKFYQALERVEGWQDMPLTVAAQAVQRSGFPDAYADHEEEALAWATALTGGDASIDCHNPQGIVGSAQAFAERLSHDYGAGRYVVEIVDVDGHRTTVSIAPVEADEEASRSVREWAIATASTTGVVASSGGGEAWINGGGRSAPDADQEQASLVRVIITTE